MVGGMLRVADHASHDDRFWDLTGHVRRTLRILPTAAIDQRGILQLLKSPFGKSQHQP